MDFLKRPFIPLDGSKASSVALTYIAPLLQHAEQVFLAHIVDPDPAPSMVIADDHGGLFLGPEERDGPAAREYLKRLASEAGVADRTTYVVEAGPPAQTILEAIKREEATMVAMATHGREGLARWALGSQTEKVLRASDVPVLAVPSRQEGEAPLPTSVKHILAPIDGSERSLDLVPHICSIVEKTKARVTLAHFIGHGDSAAAEEQGKDHLYRARCHFEDAGVLPRTKLVHEPPAQGIVGYARPAVDDDVPIDMIAMTTHGRSGVLRWALGSVTERVMRHTSLPLLVVRSAG